MYDPHSREPRGFGFVTMESANDAEAAMAATDGFELMGRTLKVQKVSQQTRPDEASVVAPFSSSRLLYRTGKAWTSSYSYTWPVLWTS